MKFYIDTCIWRDFYEARFSKKGNPIGDYATSFFKKVMKNKDFLLFSELNIEELLIKYDKDEINYMLGILFRIGILKRIQIKEEHRSKARRISLLKNIPNPDALHAILAKENRAILVTRDKHFRILKDTIKIKKPEEII